MPAFLWALGSLLVSLAGSLAGRVLIGLGVGVVTYTGISTSLNFLKSQAVTAFHQLPADVMGMLGVLRVGQCISIVSSAMVARLIINGLQSDTVKRWVLK
ncbi:DUF2523 domain-containing protein [Variovorax sp. tm]|uniref:DUF2523 domain-containing protein n=1 Tax=Variovorax atrisoli TaxID=3394203 RepID=UPI003A806F42